MQCSSGFSARGGSCPHCPPPLATPQRRVTRPHKTPWKLDFCKVWRSYGSPFVSCDALQFRSLCECVTLTFLTLNLVSKFTWRSIYDACSRQFTAFRACLVRQVRDGPSDRQCPCAVRLCIPLKGSSHNTWRRRSHFVELACSHAVHSISCRPSLRPICFGRCLSAVLVNTSRLLWRTNLNPNRNYQSINQSKSEFI